MSTVFLRRSGGLVIAALGLLSSLPAHASLVFTCDPTVDSANGAGTCTALNTIVAGLYNSSFANANANIYIQSGTTGLGGSTSGFLNLVSYTTYRNALIATGSGSALDTAALASLPAGEPATFGGGQIEVTSALGTALGLGGMVGTLADGTACFAPGVGNCYNGIITITTPTNLSGETGGTQGLYYRNGVQPSNAYDYFTVVEHETDEVLGTISCVDTGGGTLTDGCGGTRASATDLFRYTGPGARVFESTTPGAYFSFDGGVTNVATYNTLANGQDYADFITNCQHVQDATGCLGKSFDITNDGGPELAILDALGYNQNLAPEPGTMTLFGAGLAVLGAYRLRRR